MPGLNSTGAPNTEDYNLGRGRIYLADIVSATGLPSANGFRDVGNTPEFTMTVDVQDLRHQSSRECVKFTDKRFIVSQELGLGFQVDELNFQNWSDFLAGSTETYDNPHDTTWANHEDAVVSSAVVLGNWYELKDDNGARVYNINATGCVYSFEEDPAGTPVTLVANTDYEIDEQLGLVRFLPTATNVAAGDTVGWAITTGASTPQDLDQVNALKRAEVSGVMLFISENAGDCGQKIEFRFHKVSLTADGDASLIGDEVTVLNFSGVAEVNSLVTDTSKVLTIRTYDMVA